MVAQQQTAYGQQTHVVDVGGAYMPANVPQQPQSDLAALLPRAPHKRDDNRLIETARRIGERMGMTFDNQGKSRALYSFPAGGSTIEGPTVWLIEALWQEYGDIIVKNKVREERGGRVVITTSIVDMVNRTGYERENMSTLTPAPGKFANKPDQAERWATMQLQSSISKAERTTVEHFLPRWYVDTAMDAARRAMSAEILKDRDGKPITLEQGFALAIDAYGKRYGVTLEQLEEYIGEARALWTLGDFAELRGLQGQLVRGEVAVAKVFPLKAAAPSATKPAEAKKAEGLDGLASEDATEPKPNSPADVGFTKPSEPAKRQKKAAAEPPPQAPTPTTPPASPAAESSGVAVQATAPIAGPAIPLPRGFEPPKTMTAEELAAMAKPSTD